MLLTFFCKSGPFVMACIIASESLPSRFLMTDSMPSLVRTNVIKCSMAFPKDAQSLSIPPKSWVRQPLFVRERIYGMRFAFMIYISLPHDIRAISIAWLQMVIVVSFASSTIVHFKQRTLTSWTQCWINWQVFNLIQHISTSFQSSKEGACWCHTLDQWSTYNIRNIPEWMKRIIRIYQTIFVVNMKVSCCSLWRFFFITIWVHRVMICKGKEIAKEFLDNSLEFIAI